jgi:mannose-binding lectin 1
MAASRRGWDGHATLCVLGILLLVTNAQNPNVGVPASDATGQAIHRRFEYKYSFKPPYLAQKDGTVPFFEYSGSKYFHFIIQFSQSILYFLLPDAIASEESVRITPSLRSQKGMIWSRLMTAFDWWEVELQFRVTGRGRIGADGLAFW